MYKILQFFYVLIRKRDMIRDIDALQKILILLNYVYIERIHVVRK